MDIVRIVGLKMKDDKISPTDNMGKIMTLFQFMADGTIKIESEFGSSTTVEICIPNLATQAQTVLNTKKVDKT